MQSLTEKYDLIKLAKHQANSMNSRRFAKFLSYNRSKSVHQCGSYLEFTQWQHAINKDQKIVSLSNANFCKHRLCSMCAWRKSVQTTAELMAKIRAISKEREFSAIMITLTVRNPPIDQLRETVKKMSKAWDKFVKSKEIKKAQFAWFRAIEFLGDNTAEGEAHPHYHCLMLVNRSYFTSRDYLSQERMQELWRRSLGTEHDGLVYVSKVKPKNSLLLDSNKSTMLGIDELLIGAVLETVKYTQKISSIEGSKDKEPMSDANLQEFMKQIKSLRQYSVGGILKEIELEDEDLSHYIKLLVQLYKYNTETKSYELTNTSDC